MGEPVTKYDLWKSCLIVSTTAARSIVSRSLCGGASTPEGERKAEAAMPRSSELYHAILRSGLFWACESSCWFGFVPLHRILRWWRCCFGGKTKELWWWVVLIEAEEAIAAIAMTPDKTTKVCVQSNGDLCFEVVVVWLRFFPSKLEIYHLCGLMFSLCGWFFSNKLRIYVLIEAKEAILIKTVQTKFYWRNHIFSTWIQTSCCFNSSLPNSILLGLNSANADLNTHVLKESMQLNRSWWNLVGICIAYKIGNWSVSDHKL